MANLIELKGARASKPTRYAPMFTNRWFQGLWTQRNPFRDAGSTRIEEVFYGSRGDGLIDGLNVEVSNRLTLVRRPGHSVYNSKVFPAITRYYPNRVSIFNAAQTVVSEQIQVIADTASVIYDATGPSTQNVLFTKSAGAGSAYFQQVGNTLYFSDGSDQKKYLTAAHTWSPSVSFGPGSLISVPQGAGPAVLYMALGGVSLPIVASACNGIKYILWVDPQSVPSVFPNLENATVTFSGLTAGAVLNGGTYVVGIASTTEGVLVVTQSGSSYDKTADTGTGTTGNGISGGTQPSFSATQFSLTADSGQQWKCYGSSIQNWGLQAPTQQPTVAPTGGARWWQPKTVIPYFYSLLDPNGNVQVNFTPGATTGYNYPAWGPQPATGVVQTNDGGVIWINWGIPGTWSSGTAYGTPYTTPSVILDSNNNWQFVDGAGGTSGGTTPTWATTLGATTVDGALTWACLGPGAVMTTASVSYSFSTHAIDGSVSTASPVVTIQGPIVGPALLGTPTLFPPQIQSYLSLSGIFTPDPQLDQIWVWRTTQGGSTATLLLEDQIPIEPGYSGGTFEYYELGLSDSSLDNEALAPIAGTGNPPPVGLVALAYHLGCVWGAVGTTVYRSLGPDATTGNGATAWSVADYFVYPSEVVRLFPCTLGMIVFTRSSPYIISGSNTSSSPLISIAYLNNPGILSYDAFDVNGSLPNFMTSDLQVVTFDPSSGINEVGFPIGDQFDRVTTGGINAPLFTASNTYVAWHVFGQDKGLFVSDGSTGWFRLSPTPAPESGMTWSPFAQIAGGCSAVQSVEVSPGIHNLLIGPKTSGPILKRDTSVWSDNGTAYNAYATLGSIVPAQPGQFAMLEFVTTDSINIGTPLTLAIQLDEIGPPSLGLFESLTAYTHDPTQLPNTVTLNQQRFYISQTQKPAICRSFQVMINFGTDTAQNELLNLCVFGGFAQEK